MGLFRSLVIGLFIFSIPLVLITTNVRVAFSEQRVYDYSVKTFNAEERSGIPESELLRANEQLVRYLTNPDSGPLSIQVRNAEGEIVPLFNARETAHMADVKDLVGLLMTVNNIAIAMLLVLAVVMLVLWPPRALAFAALYGALLTGGLIVFVGVLAAVTFNFAWNQFHLIAFTNDLWQLSLARDHLIQMFPPPFWQRAILALAGITLLQAALIALASGIYIRRSRPAPEPEPVRPKPELPGAEGHSRQRVPQQPPRRLIP